MALPIVVILAAVAAAAAVASSSSSSSAVPTDRAKWGALEGEWGSIGSPGRDVARDAFYAPPHLFSPTGAEIVRRYDNLEKSGQWDRFIRYEVDATGKRWFSTHYFARNTLGYDGQHFAEGLADDRFSHDALLEVNEGDWGGFPDWKAALGTYLSIAQFVISVVPGIGTGILAAIAAGIALAKGQSINEAMIAAARASMPGAPVSTAAFDVAVDLAKGASLSEAAVHAAREAARLAGGDVAVRAFDVGLALSQGRSLQQAAYDVARSYIPAGNAREFADRIAAGQNVVDAARAVGGPAAEKAAREELERLTPPAAAPIINVVGSDQDKPCCASCAAGTRRGAPMSR